MAHTQPVCDQARTRLWGKRSYPRSTLLPPKSPEYYFPIKAIQEVLEFPAEKLELEQLYLCRCSKCRRHAGIEGEFDHMDDSFSEETKQELLGPYAATYALLIYIHNPGLIRRFRQKNLQLQGTNFLNKDHLLFLFDSGFLDSVDEAKVVQEEILEHQYKFLVRKLDARDEVTEISDKETLPIDEDPVPLGSGSFAEVHGFTFHDDEYLGDYFVSRQITKFARKWFKPAGMKDGLPEWFKIKQVRKIKHEHLMPILGAYQHGDIFFFLMEKAEETLGQYLRGEGTTYTPKELWEQVQGLAAGLASLHEGAFGSPITYHKDLKPANILIVGKIMKISDFGLVEFKIVGPSTGDSRNTGVPDEHGFRPYAAPAPTDNMYTRSSDVWSLGAIISEIATFDIQKKEGITQYRTDRKGEPEEGYTWGTESFHKDGKVKDCVLERHAILENRVERSKSLQNREPLDPFQEQFYTATFFPFVETLLQYHRPAQSSLPTIIVPAPTAGQVAKKIKEFCEQAEQGLQAETLSYRPNQIPDVWDDTSNGRLPDSAAASNHRLQAWTLDEQGGEIKCGLLLFTDPKHVSVTVRCWTNVVRDGYLERFQNKESYQRENNKTFATVLPSYISSDLADPKIPLQLRQLDNSVLCYWLQNIEDALRLQAAMCGHYPYKLRTFALNYWTVSKSKLWKSKKEEHQEPLHVQLWSYGPLGDHDDSSTIWADNTWADVVPIIHVAVLSSSAVFLIRVAFERPKLAKPSSSIPNDPEALTFSDVEVFHLKFDGSIPLFLKSPDEDLSTTYKFATLIFKSKDDRKLFDDYLSDLRKIWDWRKKEWDRRRRSH